ncbi:Protein Hook-like protein [Smittium mucronatum]|uniref:Protein Hook-like protein n=1 Tax=Smittium mucronatum TaxID=133383 RepID=A0A1R0GXJ4_9FUNG|nr:Protein Hook-like protein [Smittium mucronatum]
MFHIQNERMEESGLKSVVWPTTAPGWFAWKLLDIVRGIGGAAQKGSESGTVNTFNNLSKKVSSFKDLSDGIVLFEICMDIDPNWFRLIRSTEVGDNWVFKYNNLKKLYRLLLAYCEEVLLFPSANIPDPDLDSIAKENSSQEIIKVISLVLTVAVNCDNKNTYIAGIMTLTEENQGILMISIEKTMLLLESSSHDPNSINSSDINQNSINSPNPIPNNNNRDSKIETNSMLQAELLSQIEKNKTLQNNLEKFATETDKWRAKFEEERQNKIELSRQLEEYIELASTGDINKNQQYLQSNRPDPLFKAELDALRSDLDKSEYQRNELSRQLQEAILKSNKLNAEILNQKNLLLELDRLKDQEQEFLAIQEKLNKTENIVDKYKNKLEQGADLKKKVQLVEAQLKREIAAKSELETKYIALMSNRNESNSINNQSSVDSLSKLESQLNLATIHISELERKLSTVESENKKLVKVAAESQHYAQDIEEKFRDFELAASINNNASTKATPNHGSLGDAFGESPAQLIAEIERLKKELEQSKLDAELLKNNPEKELLESWVDDANKEKMEADSKVLQLERHVQSLRDQIAKLEQEPHQNVSQIESDLAKSISELQSTQEALSEANKQIGSLFKELGEATKRIGELEMQITEDSSKIEMFAKMESEYSELKDRQTKALKEFKMAKLDSENLEEWYLDLQAQLDEKDKIIRQLGGGGGDNLNDSQYSAELEEVKEQLLAARKEVHDKELNLQKAKVVCLYIYLISKLYLNNPLKQQMLRELDSEMGRMKSSMSTGAGNGNGSGDTEPSGIHATDQIRLLRSQLESKQDQIAQLQESIKKAKVEKEFESHLIGSAWLYVTRRLEKNSGFGSTGVESAMARNQGSIGGYSNRGSVAHQQHRGGSSWLEKQRKDMDRTIYSQR